MKLDNNITLYGPALYLKKQRCLVIGDTHIGYEEMLQKQGYLIPHRQFRNIVIELEKLFKKIKPKTIIINGDIKHEFGMISQTEWSETLKLIDFLAKHSQQLILIKGNHDTIIGPIAKKRSLEIKDYLIIDDYLICHGHRIIKTKEKYSTIIIGHDHPCVTIGKTRIEKYKTYLIGKYKTKKLIVMPSFNPIFLGTDILRQRTLSPYITNVMKMEAYVLGDKEILHFGSVKNLL